MITELHRNQYEPEPGSFRERLLVLKQAIPGAAPETQRLLADICRSAREVHDTLEHIDIDPVIPRSFTAGIRCFDCGTAAMESFHTSKQGGYHLCPSCFQHRLRTGRAKTAQ